MTPTQIAAMIIGLLLIGAGWWLLFRKKVRRPEAFREDWRRILEDSVDFYKALDSEGRIRFETAIQEFLATVAITGVESELEDIDRLLVASSAVIPVFRFPGWRYRNINEVLIYDAPFNLDYETRQGEDRHVLGMVGEGSMQRMMILSKPSLRQGFENESSKRHVGIHEFVHLLDKADGATDGIPELFLSKPYIIPWVRIMHEEIREMKDGDSDINIYGAKNAAEFFSVVSEYFFKRPELLKERHPELYGMLDKMFSPKER